MIEFKIVSNSNSVFLFFLFGYPIEPFFPLIQNSILLLLYFRLLSREFNFVNSDSNSPSNDDRDKSNQQIHQRKITTNSSLFKTTSHQLINHRYTLLMFFTILIIAVILVAVMVILPYASGLTKLKSIDLITSL